MNADVPPEDPGSDESLLVPPDEPLAAFEDATTVSGQVEGESIDERLAREMPDRPTPDRDEAPPGRLVDEDEPDVEPRLVGDLVPDDDLVFPVEEGAIRVRRNAPGGTDDESDGYEDQEPW